MHGRDHNYIDRQLLSILIEPIKRELHLSDTAMGLLSGTAFAICYAVASFIVAAWADRSRSRTAVLAGSLAVWSLVTALCGTTVNLIQLVLCRMGVAAAESGSGPISQAILADLYPPERRGIVYGILVAAMSFGIAASMFLGGWINTAFGWRAAFMVVGIPGIILAAVIFLTVLEPRSRALGPVEKVDAMPFGKALRYFWNVPSLRIVLLLAVLASWGGYAMLSWAATAFIRIYGMTTAEAGLSVGLATAVGLVAGATSAGAIADRWSARNPVGSAWVICIGMALYVPAGLAFAFAQDSTTAAIFFALAQFFNAFWLPVGTAIAMRLVPSTMRATTGAVLSSVHVIGLGFGPLSVGMMNDWLTPSLGADAIRYSLAMTLIAEALIAVGAIFLARRLRADCALADSAAAAVPAAI